MNFNRLFFMVTDIGNPETGTRLEGSGMECRRIDKIKPAGGKTVTSVLPGLAWLHHGGRPIVLQDASKVAPSRVCFLAVDFFEESGYKGIT
jgi:hypothetical protein